MKKKEKSESTEISKAVIILRRGGVVIYPTDTAYGIGCRWDLPYVVQRVKNIKRSTQYFPVLIHDIREAHKIANMNPQAMHLANRYWPGALTIVVYNKSKNDKIGLRIPNSKLMSKIIEKLQIPIIGTSANFHGQPAVFNYEDLDPNLIKLADYVIKGECENSKESTVVDTTVSPIKILREGAIKLK